MLKNPCLLYYLLVQITLLHVIVANIIISVSHLHHSLTYSPVIVADDANIEVACRRIMWGKCINAGQSCVAPDYVLCSPAIKDQLACSLQAAIEQFFGQVCIMYSTMSCHMYIDD